MVRAPDTPTPRTGSSSLAPLSPSPPPAPRAPVSGPVCLPWFTSPARDTNHVCLYLGCLTHLRPLGPHAVPTAAHPPPWLSSVRLCLCEHPASALAHPSRTPGPAATAAVDAAEAMRTCGHRAESVLPFRVCPDPTASLMG